MMYIMKIFVNEKCRRNKQSNAIDAAAAVFKLRYKRQKCCFEELLSFSIFTNQRVKITAIIFALEQALELFKSFQTNSYLDVIIYSDSQYAVDCMNE